MTWLIGVLAVLALIGAVFFGGIGGFTVVLMLVALGAGVALAVNHSRARRPHA